MPGQEDASSLLPAAARSAMKEGAARCWLAGRSVFRDSLFGIISGKNAARYAGLEMPIRRRCILHRQKMMKMTPPLMAARKFSHVYFDNWSHCLSAFFYISFEEHYFCFHYISRHDDDLALSTFSA